MAEETFNEEHSSVEHVQSLKDNPPVEPNKDELEEHQYESAKASYDKALELWTENVQNEEQLLTEQAEAEAEAEQEESE